MYDLGLVGGTVWIDGDWIKKNLYIKGTTIALITEEIFNAKETIDVSTHHILPGIIDPHVHFELDLGSIKSVDDFYYGSKAAAYGGVTTVIDFLEPSYDAESLKETYYRRLALAKKSNVDYQFHATIAAPKGDLKNYVETMVSLGIPTLKLFTTYSESNRRTHDESIIELLKLSERYGFTLLAHIENDEKIVHKDAFTAKNLPDSRPREAETFEALKLAQFTRQYGGKMYMVHLSSGQTLKMLNEQYKDVLNDTFIVESCPQYFTFNESVYHKSDAELYTFAPPLRTEAERQLLFKYIASIDTLGTDHCAFMSNDKKRNYLKDIPLGIGGVEHAFNIMHYHIGDRCIDKMTRNVARHHALHNKGEITVGYDADVIIYKKDTPSLINDNHGKCDYSVYDQHPINGKVVATLLRGSFVLRDNRFVGGKGQLVRRERK